MVQQLRQRQTQKPIQYSNHTACALMLMTPSFFNSTFIVYLREYSKSHQTFPKNPVENCADHFIIQALDASPIKYKILTDKMIKTDSGKNLPEVDLRIAGHVSGAPTIIKKKMSHRGLGGLNATYLVCASIQSTAVGSIFDVWWCLNRSGMQA